MSVGLQVTGQQLDRNNCDIGQIFAHSSAPIDTKPPVLYSYDSRTIGQTAMGHRYARTGFQQDLMLGCQPPLIPTVAPPAQRQFDTNLFAHISSQPSFFGGEIRPVVGRTTKYDLTSGYKCLMYSSLL